MMDFIDIVSEESTNSESDVIKNEEEIEIDERLGQTSSEPSPSYSCSSSIPPNDEDTWEALEVDDLLQTINNKCVHDAHTFQNLWTICKQFKIANNSKHSEEEILLQAQKHLTFSNLRRFNCFERATILYYLRIPVTQSLQKELESTFDLKLDPTSRIIYCKEKFCTWSIGWPDITCSIMSCQYQNDLLEFIARCSNNTLKIASDQKLAHVFLTFKEGKCKQDVISLTRQISDVKPAILKSTNFDVMTQIRAAYMCQIPISGIFQAKMLAHGTTVFDNDQIIAFVSHDESVILERHKNSAQRLIRRLRKKKKRQEDQEKGSKMSKEEQKRTPYDAVIVYAPIPEAEALPDEIVNKRKEEKRRGKEKRTAQNPEFAAEVVNKLEELKRRRSPSVEIISEVSHQAVVKEPRGKRRRENPETPATTVIPSFMKVLNMTPDEPTPSSVQNVPIMPIQSSTISLIPSFAATSSRGKQPPIASSPTKQKRIRDDNPWFHQFSRGLSVEQIYQNSVASKPNFETQEMADSVRLALGTEAWSDASTSHSHQQASSISETPKYHQDSPLSRLEHLVNKATSPRNVHPFSVHALLAPTPTLLHTGSPKSGQDSATMSESPRSTPHLSRPSASTPATSNQLSSRTSPEPTPIEYNKITYLKETAPPNELMFTPPNRSLTLKENRQLSKLYISHRSDVTGSYRITTVPSQVSSGLEDVQVEKSVEENLTKQRPGHLDSFEHRWEKLVTAAKAREKRHFTSKQVNGSKSHPGVSPSLLSQLWTPLISSMTSSAQEMKTSSMTAHVENRKTVLTEATSSPTVQASTKSAAESQTNSVPDASPEMPILELEACIKTEPTSEDLETRASPALTFPVSVQDTVLATPKTLAVKLEPTSPPLLEPESQEQTQYFDDQRSSEQPLCLKTHRALLFPIRSSFEPVTQPISDSEMPHLVKTGPSLKPLKPMFSMPFEMTRNPQLVSTDGQPTPDAEKVVDTSGMPVKLEPKSPPVLERETPEPSSEPTEMKSSESNYWVTVLPLSSEGNPTATTNQPQSAGAAQRREREDRLSFPMIYEKFAPSEAPPMPEYIPCYCTQRFYQHITFVSGTWATHPMLKLIDGEIRRKLETMDQEEAIPIEEIRANLKESLQVIAYNMTQGLETKNSIALSRMMSLLLNVLNSMKCTMLKELKCEMSSFQRKNESSGYRIPVEIVANVIRSITGLEEPI